MRPLPAQFEGYIKDGKLKLHSKEHFQKVVARMAGQVMVSIESMRSQRTLDQNAWYWSQVLPLIAEFTGHTAEELHEIYKRMFLPKRVVKYKNKEIVMAGTTTNQSISEFGEYLERILAEASELGVVVPEPRKEWMTEKWRAMMEKARLEAPTVPSDDSDIQPDMVPF